MKYGNIEGIKVGQLFDSRKELAEAGVHAPTMAGIWGREYEGACSIVLSGGYEDDIDQLDYIQYTGQGGQENGKQTSDQEFKRVNKGLQLSCEYHLPVRVSRGYQLPNGPSKGYRFDCLYYVEKYERIKGKSGFYVCRFHLKSELEINNLEEQLISNLKESYLPTPRKETKNERLIRNVKNSETVKSTYDFKCQVCGVKLDSPLGPIAIGAHIKRLGRPDEGPDVLENMLCLCPNHHDQFDKYSYFIEPETLEIKGLDDYKNKRINLRHKINPIFLEFHKKQFFNNR